MTDKQLLRQTSRRVAKKKPGVVLRRWRRECQTIPTIWADKGRAERRGKARGEFELHLSAKAVADLVTRVSDRSQASVFGPLTRAEAVKLVRQLFGDPEALARAFWYEYVIQTQWFQRKRGRSVKSKRRAA